MYMEYYLGKYLSKLVYPSLNFKTFIIILSLKYNVN